MKFTYLILHIIRWNIWLIEWKISRFSDSLELANKIVVSLNGPCSLNIQKILNMLIEGFKDETAL